MPISWYERIERRDITEGYRGYMKCDIPFLSWGKVLLDFLNLTNSRSLDPVPPVCQEPFYVIGR